MTYEDIKEALKWCEKQIEIRGTTRCNGKTLLRTIEKALEKQIAVKGKIIIKGKPENGGSYGVRICPSCGKSIDIYGDYRGCPYCLQKVDWIEV